MFSFFILEAPTLTASKHMSHLFFLPRGQTHRNISKIPTFSVPKQICFVFISLLQKDADQEGTAFPPTLESRKKKSCQPTRYLTIKYSFEDTRGKHS